MKPYIQKYPNTWWLKRKPYTLFMVREFTSVFIAGYCIFLLIFIYRLSQGLEAYEKIVESLKSPTSIILHIIAFMFTIYHSITWFNLTPKIFVLRIGDNQVPPSLIAVSNFAAWVLVSAILAWIISVV